MGLFNRLFGSNPPVTPSQLPPPEPPPSFPYELLSAPGAIAIANALSWRNEWRGSFTPVVLGPAKDFELFVEILNERKQAPEDVVLASQKIVLTDWFESRLAEVRPLDDFHKPSAWKPGTAAEENFATVRESLSKKFHPQVWIAKVPTAQPCDVPAWLKLGGWNACPGAEDHVAVWRYWQEKYGAEILCVSSDVIEATVARPPHDKDTCYALAREQFGYCDDIVTQGMGSIDALASGLCGSRSWFFWWD